MNKNILKLKPQNLPIYTYWLTASVAVVHKRIAYKLKNYGTFSDIKVAANQPLKADDILRNECCYYGNDNIELLPHLSKKRALGGAEDELMYFCGCRVDQIDIAYSDDPSSDDSCGGGKCTVFIELSLGKSSKEYHQLDGRWGKLTDEERFRHEALLRELEASDDIEYWKKRVPNWNDYVEEIGAEPDDLIY